MTEQPHVVDSEGADVNRDDDPDEPRALTDLVEQPAKVMRIGTMIRHLLEEVRSSGLDEKGRTRLAGVLHSSITELKDGLAPELDAELDRLIAPFDSDSPSESELRIAQAQLVGWLEGLFHGIQTAIYAQQLAARTQLEQMRQLPPGMSLSHETAPGTPQGEQSAPFPEERNGLYL